MKKANPTAVGAFVLGAIALALGSVLFFGSGTFLHDTERTALIEVGDIDFL